MAIKPDTTATDFKLVESILWESCCGYWLLPEHLERLKQSAGFFGIQLDEEQLGLELNNIIKGLDSSPQLIHLRVDKNGGLDLSSDPTNEDRTPYKVTLANKSIDRNDPYITHNTSNRYWYDEALGELPGFDDVILWNSDDEITETCSGNIVVELDDNYFTPPVECGLLAGTYRADLLKQGTIGEKVIKKDQLPDYTKIYIINSAVGWREAIYEPD